MLRSADGRKISVLTIAGSDSGGCAGIQADLRAIAAFGLHGVGAVTAVTAQTSQSVTAMRAVPAALVSAQIDAAFADFRIGAVKIGMLANAAVVAAVAAALRRHCPAHVVLDPVLLSTSGTPLLTVAARRPLRELIALATIVTPNVPEAQALLGCRIGSRRAVEAAARDLLVHGARAVLLKGGHLAGQRLTDVLVDADGALEFSHRRIAGAVRGTGCMLATAIACGLARGRPLRSAVADAERFLQDARRRAYQPGRGRRLALEPAPQRS